MGSKINNRDSDTFASRPRYYIEEVIMKHLVIMMKATIVTWFLFWGFMLYELFWPFTVFEIKTPYLPISVSKIHGGETQYYTENYCKYIGNTGNVTHSLEMELTPQDKKEHISDIVVVFETLRNVNVPSGCHSVTVPVLVPSGVRKSRRYRIVKNIHIKVNPFRIVDLEFKSDWFTII